MSVGFIAILGGLGFALNAIASRRAVLKVPDATVGAMISVPTGVVFFFLVLVVTGNVSGIFSFPGQGYLWLSANGVLHFVVARALYYYCVQRAGANIATVITRVSPLVSVILGVTILGELLTWEVAAGALLIVSGVTLAGINPGVIRNRHQMFSGLNLKVILVGIGVGVIWGISPIMIKIGLGESGSPLVGAFISYLAGTIVWGFSLLSRNRRAVLTGINKGAFGFFCLAGVFSSAANVARYGALSLAPVSIVIPIISAYPIFTVVLSFLFNRKIEVFQRTVIIGAIAAVIGTILLV